MLSIARKLPETQPPTQDTGAVLDRGGPAGAPWRVRTATGTLHARRAVSCLVEPAPGDTALLALLPDGGCYVLAILERESEGAPTTLRAEGDLRVELPNGGFAVAARESVDLAAGRAVSVAGASVHVNAVDGSVALQRLTALVGQVFGEAERVRVVAAAVDQAIGRLTQRLGRSHRTVEESDHLRAGHIDYRAKEHLSLHADAALVSANELVKVDAEQIHLG